jgi:hypothetical protein
MAIVATYPDSAKASLEQRLAARARERWPQIARLHIRHRGTFSYIDATLTDATTLKLVEGGIPGRGDAAVRADVKVTDVPVGLRTSVPAATPWWMVTFCRTEQA